MSSAFAIPARLDALSSHRWTAIDIGQSGAAVWRIEATNGASFLKTAPIHPLSELPGEATRLRWLAGTGIAAPRLLDAFAAHGRHWLLMSALPGQDLTHLTGRPADLVTVLATGLRRLHALDPAACPFDHRLANRLAAGAANLAAGLVDETDFDTSRLGWTGAAVIDWLETHRPSHEDLVVAHGDASLPNIMATGASWTGFVDCGRLGVADRWQDLAIACRSVIFNLGEDQVPAFLAAYGATWDEARYRYYCTLDELF